jgi:hypothetical protein
MEALAIMEAMVVVRVLFLVGVMEVVEVLILPVTEVMEAHKGLMEAVVEMVASLI